MLAVRPAYRRGKPKVRKAAFIGSVSSLASGVGTTPGRYIGTPHATNSHSLDPGGRCDGSSPRREEWAGAGPRRCPRSSAGVSSAVTQTACSLPPAAFCHSFGSSGSRRRASDKRSSARPIATSLKRLGRAPLLGPGVRVVPREADARHPPRPAAARCRRPPPRRTRARPACAGAIEQFAGLSSSRSASSVAVSGPETDRCSMIPIRTGCARAFSSRASRSLRCAV